MKEGKGQNSKEQVNHHLADEERKRSLNRRDFVRGTVLLGAGAVVLSTMGSQEAVAQTAKEALEPRKSLGPADRPAPVHIPDVSIPMRSPDSVLVGVSNTEVITIRLADVLKFHGYCAGGVAFSFRVAREAFRILCGEELPLRQNFKIYTSFHCCQAGALAYITGARSDFGALQSRGDLVLIPEERKEIIIVDKKTGKGVTLIPLVDPHGIFAPLFQRVRKEHGIAPQVQKLLHEAVQEYTFAPAQKLFRIS